MGLAPALRQISALACKACVIRWLLALAGFAVSLSFSISSRLFGLLGEGQTQEALAGSMKWDGEGGRVVTPCDGRDRSAWRLAAVTSQVVIYSTVVLKGL